MGVFVNTPADPVAYFMLEFRILWTLTLEDTLTRAMVNVLHYRKLTGSGSPDLVTVLDNFRSSVATQFPSLVNARVNYDGCDVRPLDDPLVPEILNVTSASAGSVTGDPLSAALAVVISLKTSTRGRSFQGRKHFGGLSESDTDGGDELKAASLSAWITAAGNLTGTLSDGAGFTYTPCVLSTTLSGIFLTPPYFTGADIDSVEVNPILGTMRRRKERLPS